MITTITIDETLKKEVSEYIKTKKVRGGLSGLIEILLTDYLEKSKKEEDK